jgi:hypothetical protein
MLELYIALLFIWLIAIVDIVDYLLNVTWLMWSVCLRVCVCVKLSSCIPDTAEIL